MEQNAVKILYICGKVCKSKSVKKLFFIAAPPRFVRREEDAMYGVRGQPVTIEFWVYGHPQPQVTWFKGESQVLILNSFFCVRF